MVDAAWRRRKLGLKVKIIHADRPWPVGLKVIVIPGVQMLDETLGRKVLMSLMAEGGMLCSLCRTKLDGSGMDQLWRGHASALKVNMIGATITGYDGLPDDLLGKVKFGGKNYSWNIWGDMWRWQEGYPGLGEDGALRPILQGNCRCHTAKAWEGDGCYCSVFAG